MISKLFKNKEQRQREEKIDRALKQALIEFHEHTIIDITEHEHKGWGNGTEILNTITLEELYKAFKRIKIKVDY